MSNANAWRCPQTIASPSTDPPRRTAPTAAHSQPLRPIETTLHPGSGRPAVRREVRGPGALGGPLHRDRFVDVDRASDLEDRAAHRELDRRIEAVGRDNPVRESSGPSTDLGRTCPSPNPGRARRQSRLRRSRPVPPGPARSQPGPARTVIHGRKTSTPRIVLASHARFAPAFSIIRVWVSPSSIATRSTSRI
jgi:hypothetical protein